MTERTRALMVVGLALTLGCSAPPAEPPASSESQAPKPAAVSPTVTQPKTAAQIDAQRKRLDETIWADEVAAQAYEAPFVALWDALRSGRDPISILGAFPLTEIRLPVLAPPTLFEHGIFVRTPKKDDHLALPAAQWRAQLNAWALAGYRLFQSEWHHQTFRPAKGSAPAQSVFSIVLHVETRAAKGARRIIVQGPLEVTWRPTDAGASPQAALIDASGLEWVERSGPPPFRAEELYADPKQPLMPLLVRDFDGDGDADIALPSQNILLTNAAGRFAPRTLLSAPPPAGAGPIKVASAVHGDFDGDGYGDLITTAHGSAPRLFSGGANGRFDLPARLIPLDTGAQAHPSAITAGDVDGDGDLDLWLTQYKEPYVGGQMPTPYFDANDGHPSSLLLNDGRGQFTDGTAAAGLAEKRTRRTYAASLVDVDDDADLDLVVVSDFAGVDLYLNDGKARFEDVSERWFSTRNTFGMSHVITDLTGDGWPDLYVTGMSSTTARRLTQMGLGRADRARYQEMRTLMGYGNRAYVTKPGQGGLRVADFNDQVARSGWTWGVAALDVENDGDMDLAAANGNRSGETAADYCTEFWRHDIYVDQSTEDPALARYFQGTLQRITETGMSWNGFEHNHLFLNRNGQQFRNVAFLLGLAHEADARSMVAADLDGDGRRDLLVVLSPTPQARRFRLLWYRNQWPSAGHWIGFRVSEAAKRPAIGARVSVNVKGQVRRVPLVSGDSFLAQHPNVAHFGLGEIGAVQWAEIRWPDGHTQRLDAPTTGTYHPISPTP